MKYLIPLIISMLLFTGCTLQSGYTKDQIHGYDRGVAWNHLYLLNDHTTVYCVEPNSFNIEEVLEQAKINNSIIEVHYEKYILRGALCSSGQNMESVVVTRVKLI